MRAIILAAGLGSRFRGEVKGLLEINGETLLTRLIRQLKCNGISSIYVVVGYQAERIMMATEQVAFIYDKKFQSGMNSNSLKIALDTIGYDDSLILDSDIVLAEGLLSKLLDSFNGESISLVDLNVYDDESMKLVLKDDRIVKYSKEEGIGAEICTIVSMTQLKDVYQDLILERYKWWGIGPNATNFRFVNVKEDSHWMDIDTEAEYFRAKAIFEGS